MTAPDATLSKGERALVMRALRFFMHEHQVLIGAARKKYERRPEVAADHARHHQQQIDAAEKLFERLRLHAFKR